MISDDARMTMPPWPELLQGPPQHRDFHRSWPLSVRKRWQLLPTGANGQPAVAGYLWDEQTTAFLAETIIVLTFHACGSKRSPPSARAKPFRPSTCPSNYQRQRRLR